MLLFLLPFFSNFQFRTATIGKLCSFCNFSLPYPGRQFYKCGDDSKCKFFLWADEGPSNDNGVGNNRTGPGDNLMCTLLIFLLLSTLRRQPSILQIMVCSQINASLFVSKFVKICFLLSLLSSFLCIRAWFISPCSYGHISLQDERCIVHSSKISTFISNDFMSLLQLSWYLNNCIT